MVRREDGTFWSQENFDYYTEEFRKRGIEHPGLLEFLGLLQVGAKVRMNLVPGRSELGDAFVFEVADRVELGEMDGAPGGGMVTLIQANGCLNRQTFMSMFSWFRNSLSYDVLPADHTVFDGKPFWPGQKPAWLRDPIGAVARTPFGPKSLASLRIGPVPLDGRWTNWSLIDLTAACSPTWAFLSTTPSKYLSLTSRRWASGRASNRDSALNLRALLALAIAAAMASTMAVSWTPWEALRLSFRSST